jgi:hypothetical protein
MGLLSNYCKLFMWLLSNFCKFFMNVSTGFPNVFKIVHGISIILRVSYTVAIKFLQPIREVLVNIPPIFCQIFANFLCSCSQIMSFY